MNKYNYRDSACVYVYMCICVCVCLCLCFHIEREREYISVYNQIQEDSILDMNHYGGHAAGVDVILISRCRKSHRNIFATHTSQNQA